MRYDTLVVGAYGTNCYVIYSSDGGQALLIDPAFDTERIDALIGGRAVPYVILTHGHIDHICMSGYFSKKYGAKLCVGEAEAECLRDEKLYRPLPIAVGYGQPDIRPDILFTDGDTLDFGGYALHILATPGHTEGGISIYCAEGLLFSGDTIFKDSYGRTDFPGGDQNKLFSSIRRLLALPADTVILPGHGPATTVGAERTLYGL